MSEFIRTDLKIKQSDGSWQKYSPTVTLDSVMLDNGESLSSVIDSDGKIIGDAMAPQVEFKTFTLNDI